MKGIKLDDNQKMKKKISLTFILLVLAVLLIANFWWNNQLSPVNSDSAQKAFVIEKGQGVSDIATKLKQEGFIRSDLAFKIYARQNSLSSKIQAGTFKLASSQSVKEIAETLTQNPLDEWVTLVEGWRVEEMANRLNAEMQINKDDFLKLAKEGYMFPDTYLFPREASPAAVVNIMRANFDKKFTSDLKDKIRSQGLTEDQGVILASIVEREARSDDVRTKVASILLKRYKVGIALNADATVQYANDTSLLKQNNLTKFWEPITREDYKSVVSPYNTYLNAGFPPAPICNPSLSSLNAVADADPSTPYLYYYHDSKGNSFYAKTLEEHNQNAAHNP